MRSQLSTASLGVVLRDEAPWGDSQGKPEDLSMQSMAGLLDVTLPAQAPWIFPISSHFFPFLCYSACVCAASAQPPGAAALLPKSVCQDGAHQKGPLSLKSCASLVPRPANTAMPVRKKKTLGANSASGHEPVWSRMAPAGTHKQP